VAAATIYSSEGLARQASAAARRARELAAICGDVRTPGLADLGQDPDRLSRREQQVAAMAAAGSSSREIAAELYLSVRTVDNHLQNIYGKLGITTREQLANALKA
jgi:DNA-binding NarL/FixJ family response regulator